MYLLPCPIPVYYTTLASLKVFVVRSLCEDLQYLHLSSYFGTNKIPSLDDHRWCPIILMKISTR